MTEPSAPSSFSTAGGKSPADSTEAVALQGFREIQWMDMRLTYADCDPAGIIYFAAWFGWMERVQSEWMFRNDLRQDTLLDRYGFKTITRATECEYLAQATLFDQIRLSYGITRLGRSSIRGEVWMTRLDDAVQVARGSITVVILDADNTPIPVPEPLLSLVRSSLPVI